MRMRRQEIFWRNALAGLLIGIGCVLPGVSGGVMAVSFGLYRPMLDAVLGIFHDTRKKLLFLAPLALGGAAGLMLGPEAWARPCGCMKSPCCAFSRALFWAACPTCWRRPRRTGAFTDDGWSRWRAASCLRCPWRF